MKECSKELTQTVIGCAIEVHRTLGAGLLENTDEKCLAYELSLLNIPFIVQAPIAIQYKNISLDCGYRLDFLVDDCLILELKSVEKILKIHEAQVLTYLKLTNISTGLLITKTNQGWLKESNAIKDNSVFSVVSVSQKIVSLPTDNHIDPKNKFHYPLLVNELKSHSHT